MRKSRISKVKQQKLLEHFVAGTASRCTAEIVGVDHKSASYYFHRLREVIDYQLKQETLNFLDGKIDIDESQFHEKIRIPNSNRTGGKIPVFILVRKNGNIGFIRAFILIKIIRFFKGRNIDIWPTIIIKIT